jgi:hypothetical protein
MSQLRKWLRARGFYEVLVMSEAAATICGKRFEKLLRLALRRFSGSPFLVAIGGIGHF